MNEQFGVIEKAIGPVIEIEERIPVWRMPATFARDFERVAAYITSQDAKIVDMPYAHYLDMDWEIELTRGKLSSFVSMFFKKWHFLAGMVSSEKLQGEGELKSKEWPSTRFVRAVHYGPYQACSKTYVALFEWAKVQGLTLKNESLEFYANDPSKVSKAEIKTIILIPLK